MQTIVKAFGKYFGNLQKTPDNITVEPLQDMPETIPLYNDYERYSFAFSPDWKTFLLIPDSQFQKVLQEFLENLDRHELAYIEAGCLGDEDMQGIVAKFREVFERATRTDGKE